jgi:hypothetical protein
MTRSALKAKFARLTPTRDIDRVHFGSPNVIVLTLGRDLSRAKAIEAVFALHKRGMPTLKAKRAVEAAIDKKRSVLDVPVVEDLKRLAAELRDSGFNMSVVAGHAVAPAQGSQK